MSIKIDAPSSWAWIAGDGGCYASPTTNNPCYRARIVRESDYRKLMAVVRAADVWYRRKPARPTDELPLMDALYALERHLEKRK